MKLCNSIESYGFVSKILHWLIALLVLVMLVVGASFGYLPDNIVDILMPIHKSMGVTILGLMVVRLVWRLANPVPRLPKKMPRWQMILAKSVHHLFYLLLIAMPITGIVMTLAKGYSLPFWSFGNIELSFIPKDLALGHLMAHWH